MKAFLLAAGRGTRLKPYTDAHPKCMIPIHGVPLLRIWIDLFERHGIGEVLINTHHHAEQVHGYLSEIQPCTRVVLQSVYEPRLLGSAGTIWQNRSFVADQDDFIIAYADNLTNLDLTKMIDFHRNFHSMGGVLTMGLMRAPDPTACGIVTLDTNGRIVDFVEKPRHPQSDLANGGIYIAAREIFDAFSEAQRRAMDVFDLGHHLLPLLAGKMYGYEIGAYLKDIGTPQAYQTALTEWPAAQARGV
jgi:mannose-1-phosphate guanylyltransferase